MHPAKSWRYLTSDAEKGRYCASLSAGRFPVGMSRQRAKRPFVSIRSLIEAKNCFGIAVPKIERDGRMQYAGIWLFEFETAES